MPRKASEVVPDMSVNDSPHRMLTNPKHGGDVALLRAGMQSSNLNYLRCGQFGRALPLAINGNSSALDVHVGDVFYLCSNEKMLRSNALPVVAVVQHLKTLRDATALHYPRNPMASGGISSENSKHSIPVGMQRRSPFPTPTETWIGWVNRATKIHFHTKPVRELLIIVLRKIEDRIKVWLHSISSVDCLPRLRLLVQRAGIIILATKPS